MSTRTVEASWWLVGTLALVLVAFVPMPWNWPPTSVAELLPPSSDGPAIVALVFAVVAFLLVRPSIFKQGKAEDRRLAWCVALLVIQALLLRLAVESRPFVVANTGFAMPEAILVFPWIIPVGLATILFSTRHGLILAAGSALLPGITPLSGASPILSTGLFVATLVAVFGLRHCPLRWHVISGCTKSGMLFGIVGLLQTSTHSLVPAELALAFFIPLLVGLLGGLALMALLPFAEWATGNLSDITLIEYGSHHELLDLLRDEAPGTWNHTIMVADLAESAARAIGAEALLCRTAALYHDIGKIRDPDIFAENQRGISPHNRLSPQKSAEKIIAHVTDGLVLASEYRLPEPLRAIIAEHHGTSIVRFFFAQAAQGIEDPVELEKLKKKFRYPGPPPATRESGIIALADTIEAAARSMPDLDETGINNLVFKLIADRIQEGELNQCPLTLAELALVRENFVNTLISRHHKRPAYPAMPARRGTQSKLAGRRKRRTKAVGR